jgi:hypothetical protein
MNPTQPNQLTAEQYHALPPEVKANLIITDMLTAIDALIDMRGALNNIIDSNPELFGMDAQINTTDSHTHEGCADPECADPSCEEEE